MKRWIVSIVSVFITVGAAAQNYPQGYFSSPLTVPLYLSANFGAIRGNHFHSGIDIKTQEKEGLPVLAAADGYVVRIKVSPFGYGRALYINHPNGYTTVYAHLQRFNDEIDSIVLQEQYSRKKFEIEMFPPAGKIKVEKGQVIALSGNSGGSTGPHLHFEIRDTKSEEIIDPLLFGLPIEDVYAPKLSKSFLVYEMNEDFKHRNGHYPYVEVKRRLVDLWGDTVKVKPGQYNFAAWGEDFLNDGRDGVHLNYVQVYEGSEKTFDCGIDRFAFDETRMVNAHIEYTDYRAHSQRWHKCFVDDGNELGFYAPRKKIATAIKAGEVKPIIIKALDIAGHTDSFTFYLAGDSTQPAFMEFHSQSKNVEFAYPGKVYLHSDKDYGFNIPKGALYDTVLVTTKHSQSKRKNLYAGFVSIMTTDIPLHKSFTVSIRPKNVVGLDESKLLVVRLTGRNLKNTVSEGGHYSKGFVTTTAKTFGIFSLAYDDVKPVIDRYKLKDSIVIARITDNLSGIHAYNAYIDGEWMLLEYDAKSDMVWGTLPASLVPGKHELKIEVTDNKNNSATMVQTITK